LIKFDKRDKFDKLFTKCVILSSVYHWKSWLFYFFILCLIFDTHTHTHTHTRVRARAL